MTDDQDAHLLAITLTARRRLTDHLPETDAEAEAEHWVGPSWTPPPHRQRRVAASALR